MIRSVTTMNYSHYVWFSVPRAISSLPALVYAAGDVVLAGARRTEWSAW